jgi:DNA-binding MarR family transcriptional regulator
MPASRDQSTRATAEKLADILTVLQRRFLMNLSKELARGNVSFPQYFLLGFLSQHQTLSMSEIAKKMGHTTAAATGLVDRLETLAYVKRAHSTDDRRKIMVQITREGASLVGQIREDVTGNILKIFELLTPAERVAWLHIYEKIFTFCESCKTK